MISDFYIDCFSVDDFDVYSSRTTGSNFGLLAKLASSQITLKDASHTSNSPDSKSKKKKKAHLDGWL
jgi:hypothetical protein